MKNKNLLHAVTIDIRGLNQGENSVSIGFDASLLEYPEFDGTGNVKGTLRRDGDRLDLEAAVSANGNFECTRCADSFRDTVSAALSLHFVPPQMEPGDGDPNVHVYDPFSASEIDILSDIRDALILAVPMRHLCRSDCKGLCPVCGNNLNHGTCDCHEIKENEQGWAALNTLRERLRAEENTAG